MNTTNTVFEVTFEPTPNEQSMKFNIKKQNSAQSLTADMSGAKPLSPTPSEYRSIQDASNSPLARKLFGFPWTEAVYIGPDFITITKQDWVEWKTLAEPLAGLIGEHLESGEPVVISAAQTTASAADSPEVQLIKKILNEEIRPEVALHGGDIVFHKYENRTVYVYMQGACSGCASSTYTLRMGVETRLKSALPEIEAVEAI